MRPGGFTLILLVIGLCFSALFSVFPAQAKTRVEVNIFFPGAAWNTNLLNNFQADLGIKFTAAKWYMDWATAFDTGVANRLNNNGYIPEMTWEPSLNSNGVSYDDVVNGIYDPYIIQTAQTVKNLGFPIRIALAPEMNATWTPWGGLSGNNPDNFKAFWQHTVQIFDNQGANNITWIWSPNVIPYGPERVGSYGEMYPGNSYVDYMGLDGYNWGTSQPWSVWQSFREVFLDSYNELLGVSSKDILIMEMASTELGGSKAAWITDMYNELQNSFPRIKGFTWFHINKETDWRIDSSASAKASFAAGYHGTAVVTAPPPNTAPAGTTKTTQPKSNGTAPVVATNELVPEVTNEPQPSPADYAVTTPIRPKIAGTILVAERTSMRSPEKLRLLGGILLGGLIVGGLFIRRMLLIHSYAVEPIQPTSPVVVALPKKPAAKKMDGVGKTKPKKKKNQTTK